MLLAWRRSTARAIRARALFLRRLHCWRWFVAIGALQAAILPSSAGEVEVVRRDPQHSMPVEIIRQHVSDDRTFLDIVVRAPKGIFSLLFDPPHASTKDIGRIRIRVKGVKACEGLNFYRAGKEPVEAVDLHRAEGVTIVADGEDCSITVGPPAVKILLGGGKFQFIDFYRN